MSFEPKKFEDIFEEMKERSPVVSDFEVGSVARTLYESFSYELALLYEKMDKVYLSGFVDTAQGVHLEQVVAVLGISRGLPDFATGTVEFIRDAGKEDITIPPGTLVATEETTSQEKKVYQTIEEKIFPKSESTFSVRIQALNRGETFTTGKETIVIMPRPIPGVKAVINNQPLEFNGKRQETDVELRERAKSMLISSGKATSVTIENAVLALPGIKGVMLKEFDENQKNGEPGVIRIFVDGVDMNIPSEKRRVREAIDKVKAAGIFVHLENKVITGISGVIGISLNPELTLTMTERLAIEEKASEQIVGLINELKNGQPLKFSKLITKILAIEEIEDVEDFEFTTSGTGSDNYSYATSKEIEVAKDDSLGFVSDRNFMCVAADAKPLEVAVEIKFKSSNTNKVSKKKIEQKLEAYFKKLSETDSAKPVKSDELIKLLEDDTKTEIDPEYLIFKADPWCPSSVPQRNPESGFTMIEPNFMERPFLGRTFLYKDHLEITGAIKVSFPPDTEDDRKEDALEEIMNTFEAYLDALAAEENLQFDSLSEALTSKEDNWTIEIESKDFSAFRGDGELLEEVANRVKKKELEIASFEKARLRMISRVPCLLINEVKTKFHVRVESMKLHLWIARESVPPSYLASLPLDNESNTELTKEDILFEDIQSVILNSELSSDHISESKGFYEIDWEDHYKDTIARIMPVKEYALFDLVSSGGSAIDGLSSTSKELKSRFHVRSVEELEILSLLAPNLELKITLLPETKQEDQA